MAVVASSPCPSNVFERMLSCVVHAGASRHMVSAVVATFWRLEQGGTIDGMNSGDIGIHEQLKAVAELKLSIKLALVNYVSYSR